MGGTTTPSESQTNGKLKYELVEGCTTATHVYATYPLKFLHPRRTIHQSFDTYITVQRYTPSLLLCVLAVVLGTQATTKVFKSDDEGQFVSQTFLLKVAPNATLAFLPDPVTCFERAKYRQTQVFHLEENSNLVFVDWLTSGRKRNYLATGSIRDNRTETLEHWDFCEYDTTSEVFVGGVRLVTDRVRLAESDDPRTQGAAMSDYEEEDEKWVQWFCSLSGNEPFCEVAQSYIEDSFNLYGLRAMVPNYQDALNIILDLTDIPYDDDVPAYAAELYGLIHARYIITAHGLDAMVWGRVERGRVSSADTVVMSLDEEVSGGRLWYVPESAVRRPACCAVDGAYFGTTFPHLFFLTYRELEPAPSTLLYVPRVFGYKIHNKSENRRRLAILAKEDEDEEKTQQQRRTLTGARRKGVADSTADGSSSRVKKRTKQEV
ncbi:Casein kinase II, regulatory subunit, beta-sheet [Phytophthora cactorum]|nr:Casein kinase II, regulatory subunit, beta-sheet [Phytophthora cactorum]